MRSHSEWNEAFVQELIAHDPAVLGFGDLELVGKERKQVGGGRLDLLLDDSVRNTRYAVEVQLGKTDPEHIFRTIEYWDLEKRRDPAMHHVAVIVAEEVEGRFFNVIGLLNQAIPLIAIKMSAVKIGEQQTLIFTRVLDHAKQPARPLKDIGQSVDRGYWEGKSSAISIQVVDLLFRLIEGFCPNAELTYKKPYIGLRVDGRANNFCVFYPRKEALKVRVFLDPAPDIDARLNAASIEYEAIQMPRAEYDLRLSPAEVTNQGPLLAELLRRAYLTSVDRNLDETLTTED